MRKEIRKSQGWGKKSGKVKDEEKNLGKIKDEEERKKKPRIKIKLKKSQKSQGNNS